MDVVKNSNSNSNSNNDDDNDNDMGVVTAPVEEPDVVMSAPQSVQNVNDNTMESPPLSDVSDLVMSTPPPSDVSDLSMSALILPPPEKPDYSTISLNKMLLYTGEFFDDTNLIQKYILGFAIPLPLTKDTPTINFLLHIYEERFRSGININFDLETVKNVLEYYPASDEKAKFSNLLNSINSNAELTDSRIRLEISLKSLAYVYYIHYSHNNEPINTLFLNPFFGPFHRAFIAADGIHDTDPRGSKIGVFWDKLAKNKNFRNNKSLKEAIMKTSIKPDTLWCDAVANEAIQNWDKLTSSKGHDMLAISDTNERMIANVRIIKEKKYKDMPDFFIENLSATADPNNKQLISSVSSSSAYKIKDITETQFTSNANFTADLSWKSTKTPISKVTNDNVTFRDDAKKFTSTSSKKKKKDDEDDEEEDEEEEEDDTPVGNLNDNMSYFDTYYTYIMREYFGINGSINNYAVLDCSGPKVKQLKRILKINDANYGITKRVTSIVSGTLDSSSGGNDGLSVHLKKTIDNIDPSFVGKLCILLPEASIEKVSNIKEVMQRIVIDAVSSGKRKMEMFFEMWETTDKIDCPSMKSPTYIKSNNVKIEDDEKCPGVNETIQEIFFLCGLVSSNSDKSKLSCLFGCGGSDDFAAKEDTHNFIKKYYDAFKFIGITDPIELMGCLFRIKTMGDFYRLADTALIQYLLNKVAPTANAIMGTCDSYNGINAFASNNFATIYGRPMNSKKYNSFYNPKGLPEDVKIEINNKKNIDNLNKKITDHRTYYTEYNKIRIELLEFDSGIVSKLTGLKTIFDEFVKGFKGDSENLFYKKSTALFDEFKDFSKIDIVTIKDSTLKYRFIDLTKIKGTENSSILDKICMKLREIVLKYLYALICLCLIHRILSDLIEKVKSSDINSYNAKIELAETEAAKPLPLPDNTTVIEQLINYMDNEKNKLPKIAFIQNIESVTVQLPANYDYLNTDKIILNKKEKKEEKKEIKPENILNIKGLTFNDINFIKYTDFNSILDYIRKIINNDDKNDQNIYEYLLEYLYNLNKPEAVAAALADPITSLEYVKSCPKITDLLVTSCANENIFTNIKDFISNTVVQYGGDNIMSGGDPDDPNDFTPNNIKDNFDKNIKTTNNIFYQLLSELNENEYLSSEPINIPLSTIFEEQEDTELPTSEISPTHFVFPPPEKSTSGLLTPVKSTPGVSTSGLLTPGLLTPGVSTPGVPSTDVDNYFSNRSYNRLGTPMRRRSSCISVISVVSTEIQEYGTKTIEAINKFHVRCQYWKTYLDESPGLDYLRSNYNNKQKNGLEYLKLIETFEYINEFTLEDIIEDVNNGNGTDDIKNTDTYKNKTEKRIKLLTTQHEQISKAIKEFVELNIKCNILLLRKVLAYDDINFLLNEGLIDLLSTNDYDLELLNAFYAVDLFIDFYFNGFQDKDDYKYEYYKKYQALRNQNQNTPVVGIIKSKPKKTSELIENNDVEALIIELLITTKNIQELTDLQQKLKPISIRISDNYIFKYVQALKGNINFFINNEYSFLFIQAIEKLKEEEERNARLSALLTIAETERKRELGSSSSSSRSQSSRSQKRRKPSASSPVESSTNMDNLLSAIERNESNQRTISGKRKKGSNNSRKVKKVKKVNGRSTSAGGKRIRTRKYITKKKKRTRKLNKRFKKRLTKHKKLRVKKYTRRR